jgi:hypothetical protein
MHALPQARIYLGKFNVVLMSRALYLHLSLLSSHPLFSYPPSPLFPSYPLLSPPIPSYPLLSLPIPSYPFLTLPIPSYPFLSPLIPSYPLLSPPIPSYPLISPPIPSYPSIQIVPLGWCLCTCLFPCYTWRKEFQKIRNYTSEYKRFLWESLPRNLRGPLIPSYPLLCIILSSLPPQHFPSSHFSHPSTYKVQCQGI